MNAFDLRGGYTQEQLDAAFTLVAPSDNWKLPVNTFLPGDLSVPELALLTFAVPFYTGSVPTLTRCRDAWGVLGWRVTADGYYATVGA
jgi:hypothetical protein